MATDLEIIKELEKEIGIQLRGVRDRKGFDALAVTNPLASYFLNSRRLTLMKKVLWRQGKLQIPQ